MTAVRSLQVDQVPIAVVDVETTGLHPGGDRIIELAVARVEPGKEPEIVLDTLVNPQRNVAATEIHGITDRDVRDAPVFRDIASGVAGALEGAIFAAYNVYFDVRFLTAELGRAGVSGFPPYLCLMYLRPLLGIGGRCSLDDACRAHEVPHTTQHVAADDALAGAHLWLRYREAMDELDIRTFGDLARRKAYKFTKSFSQPPLPVSDSRPAIRTKSRWSGMAEIGSRASLPGVDDRVREYWESLKAALADLRITDEETRYLGQKQRSLNLSDPMIRTLHGRAFAGLLAEVCDDRIVDDDEVEQLTALVTCLRELGWAPGDPLRGATSRDRASKGGFFARLFDR